MADAFIKRGGSGGDGSDECTVTADCVVAGKSYIGADTDDEVGIGRLIDHDNYTNAISLGYEPHSQRIFTRIPVGAYRKLTVVNYPEIWSKIADINNAIGLTAAKVLAGQNVGNISGTATNDATATDGYVYSGKTYYGQGTRRTGTMTVSSVVSFSVAAYSTSQVLCTWKNPAKGPYGGVIIRYKTGSYPTSVTDGTLGYQGVGTSYALNGTSTTYISGLKAGTAYNFRIWMYCNTSVGTIYSGYKEIIGSPTARSMQTFTASGTFTVPNNVRSIDIFVVGAGGGGHSRSGTGNYSNYYASGGGGGYTSTKKAYNVTPGQQFPIVVGICPKTTSTGGESSFGSIVTAAGGKTGGTCANHRAADGADGGSGGAATHHHGQITTPGKDGSSGGDVAPYEYDENTHSATGGIGQGRTTRAFAESNGTLYSNGGYFNWGAVAPANNTGHGGFGTSNHNGATIGGSGVVIVRWGY